MELTLKIMQRIIFVELENMVYLLLKKQEIKYKKELKNLFLKYNQL